MWEGRGEGSSERQLEKEEDRENESDGRREKERQTDRKTNGRTDRGKGRRRLIVGSLDRRSLQLSKSCISLQPFERTNGRQKDELNQRKNVPPSFFFFSFFFGGGGGGAGWYMPVRMVASQSNI